jgi:hypothetical protein
MAVLTIPAFISKYFALFANNSSRLITETIMREFTQDVADSFQTILGGATITSWKSPCQVATTVNVGLSGEQTIDGVLTNGSRVLVKNQSSQSENGIYVSAAGAWSRATDADAAPELEGAAVGVTQGTTQQNTVWLQVTDNVTLGTSAIVWQNIGFGFSSSGITNSAANNEVMKSDGTNAVASGLFSATAGDIKLGSPSGAGTTRTISTDGSGSNIDLLLDTKGTGTITTNAGNINNEFTGEYRIDKQSTGLVNTVHNVLNVSIDTTATGAAGAGVELLLVAPNNTGAPSSIGAIRGILQNATAGVENGAMTFATRSGGGAISEKMIIAGDGNVGVGEISPTRRFEVSGSTAVKAGTSTGQIARVGGTIKTDTATTGNVGTGDDTLQTYSVPANTLATNGDTLSGTCSGTFAATANNKRLRVKFGATTIFDSGAIAWNTGDWVLQFEIVRTGGTTQKAFGKLSTSNSTLYSFADYSTATETLTGAVTLLVTGEATADNDIVKQMFKLRWEPSE